MSSLVAERRTTFERYAAMAKRSIRLMLAQSPVYDGVGVKIGDALGANPGSVRK